jgi:putative membrane protein
MTMSEKTIDSKYIEQHLANERTYLAWVRTAIAIIGIGFLAISLHFNTDIEMSYVSDSIAIVMSIGSVVTGMVMMIFATLNYFRKLKQINSQTFSPSRFLVINITILTMVITFLFLLYTIL